MLGETRSPYQLVNGLRLFSIESARWVGYWRCVGLCIQGLRGQSEEAILFIDIPNSRGLVRGETRSSYLLAIVSREQLTFRTGLSVTPLHPKIVSTLRQGIASGGSRDRCASVYRNHPYRCQRPPYKLRKVWVQRQWKHYGIEARTLKLGASAMGKKKRKKSFCLGKNYFGFICTCIRNG